MIDVSEWGKFDITKLFDMSLPKGDLQVKKVEDGDIPLITPSNSNNGMLQRISKHSPSTLYDKGSLTVDMFGNAYYQEEDFFVTAHGHVNVLLPKMPLNIYTGTFLASTIRTMFFDKYGFNEMCTQKVLKAESIWLPATSDGKPDWDYMESYMKAVMEESEKSLENLKKADDTKHLIDVSGWGEFRVGDLFDKLTLKCLKKDFNKAIDCSEEQTDEFSLPLTNAKHFNNGIQFYGRPDDWESAEMTIDIVSNGAIAAGDVYAQPQRTGVLWDSYLVKCKYDITSELVLQYMSCVIQRCVKQYFGWDDKCTWDKVKEQIIRLPITSVGEPDWQYMEDYMRRIMDKSEQIISDLQIGV
ncbi:MAG: restriction endonuclease subunit S [Butyrivibrio sp.]|uniref:restriction endonuclease subunit S n=1 Tax=Butyrivibrio sp. TaxID=28121 RepID=UPI001B40DF3C|nr:restriction endonuclease subunit S [Butyrivibrio sp.]MBP3783237.1 restriction endonuclease subunit S [Butyrivibrio sp.]